MNRIALSILSAAWACSFASAAHAQTTFKVMTLNLWHSGASAFEVATNNVVGPARALPLMGKFIASSMGTSAGLVSLQEVDSFTSRANFNSPQVIDDNIGAGWANWFGKAMDYRGGDFGNAVLSKVKMVDGYKPQHWNFGYDLSKFEACKAARAIDPLSSAEACDYGMEPRQATATKHDFGSGHLLWFVALHLDPHRNGAIARQQQLFEVLGNAKRFDPDQPVIIAGDFNIPAPSAAIPGSAELHEEAMAIVESAGFSIVQSSGRDYVLLYDPHRRLEVVAKARLNPVISGVKLSDHTPLLVDFRWN